MPTGKVGCAEGHVRYNNECMSIEKSKEIMKEELDRLKKNDKEYLEQVKRDLKRQDVLKAAENALSESETLSESEGGKRRKKRKTRRRKKSRKSRRRKGKKSRKSRRRRRRRTRKKKGGTHDYKSVENDNKEMVADAFNQKNLGKSYQEF